MEKLVDLLKEHDMDTYYHSFRVAKLSLQISRIMGLTEREQQVAYYCGLLHDIGKLEVDKRILTKSDKLTQDEWSSIQQHPILGYQILKRYPIFDNEINYTVLFHHERLNGSGYPFKLSEDQIPVNARIVAVAESYDAMINNRPYSRKKSVKEALNLILSEKGTLFDPIVVDAIYQYLNDKV